MGIRVIDDPGYQRLLCPPDLPDAVGFARIRMAELEILGRNLHSKLKEWQSQKRKGGCLVTPLSGRTQR